MAKRAKTKWLNARVDDPFYEKAAAYTENTELTIADLVRVGVEEYMANHPTKAIPMLENFPGIPASTQIKSQE